MSNYTDLKAALEAAEAAVDELTEEVKAALDNAAEAATALNAELTAAQQQVDQLQQALDECEDSGPPPEPEPTDVIFGSSDNANVPGYDRVGSARKYFGGQISGTWNTGSLRDMVEHATHVLWVSFKALPGTGTNTPLDQFLKGCSNIPLQGIRIGDKANVKVMVTVFHEPENDGGDPSGGHNLNEYNNAYEQARVIVDRYDYAALGPVRMNSKDASLNNKYWPTTEVDFDGWDCYYQGIQCPKNLDQSGSAVYSKILASYSGGQGLNATGKPLAIGETGIGRVGSQSATDPKRIQRTREMRAALVDSGHTVLASWWNAKNDDTNKCGNPTGCQFVDKSVADAWFKA